ncbi:hypothetical protein [Microtetraspora sp. NBRC 13810]|uniref:hypothetical protein n=1 Tax=Microtetraspora sp. NBRC 13810 TaxID=3030990 RepID=UPI00255755A8|nr:hypothetical protein [Microtetraspora sp. NBRC 13810]
MADHLLRDIGEKAEIHRIQIVHHDHHDIRPGGGTRVGRPYGQWLRAGQRQHDHDDHGHADRPAGDPFHNPGFPRPRKADTRPIQLEHVLISR